MSLTGRRKHRGFLWKKQLIEGADILSVMQLAIDKAGRMLCISDGRGFWFNSMCYSSSQFESSRRALKQQLGSSYGYRERYGVIAVGWLLLKSQKYPSACKYNY